MSFRDRIEEQLDRTDSVVERLGSLANDVALESKDEIEKKEKKAEENIRNLAENSVIA